METKITNLLNRLTESQEELLALLSKKREFLVSGDHHAIRGLEAEEKRIAAELQSCQEERQALLAEAAEQGLPGDNLVVLADSLPGDSSQKLREPIEAARERSQLLQHESLTHWVAMQRSLLHLSHMLEIIATGGQSRPTYENGRSAEPSGALMDHAV